MKANGSIGDSVMINWDVVIPIMLGIWFVGMWVLVLWEHIWKK